MYKDKDAINIIIGRLNTRIGFNKLCKLKPALNQTIISLSLYHLLSVKRIARKIVSDKRRGRCFNKLKTRIVSTVSLGIIPFAASRKIYTALWATTMPDNIKIVESAVKNSSLVNDDLNSMAKQ
jgi:hypothetical protein